ncbi:ornithine--oxo-acid transaminase [Nitrosococcus wardiae]|uniref:ornithine aminotransferase n=1 Tax=Nitrosococcus wardiae TaxID=1814290 RepID=A0A4P7C2F7_9GAMM|nr:ornithine--oxo-acid transaminase [Nitrosococcus wardiae]QBQ55867.1 ornithine--oxo-acid transaminase [Nitrosococcus wardiae]
MNPIIELENQYSAHNYHPLPVVLTRGEGVYLWDTEGKRYLDMMSAYSAVGHGHADPRLVQALVHQAQRLTLTSRAFYTDRLGPLLKYACELSGQDRALPMNTGAEAVETALKAARKWAYQVKRVPAGQAEILACEGNFHGRTIAIVGLSSEAQYREGFGPFPAGLKCIPYNNLEALEAAITPHTAAFLVEPIQGEGGIIIPDKGYLRGCAEICRRHHVLLICDEVQTGLGRTGKLFACQHEGVQPDGLILGKALGGGLLPLSLFLAREEVMGVFQPGDHGSTFGGNPLACAVALKALKILVEDRLPERSAELGEDLLQQLHRLQSPLIREIRGRGLFIGIEVDPQRVTARAVCEALMERGLLSKETHDVVVRLAPPLTIAREQIHWAVECIIRTFQELEENYPASTTKVSSQ